MRWAVLEGLGEAEQAEFLALGRRRTFARNEVVCHMGDPADSYHLVERGRLGVRVSLANGDEAMINIIGPGASFGELALVRTDRQRTATIVALEQVTTLAIPGSAFASLRDQKPQFRDALVRLMADRVDDLSHRLIEEMYLGFDRRLQSRLLDLARAYAEGTGVVHVPLTQSQLAQMTGGTRPTVNLALQRLADQGIVALSRGRIEILDVEALRRKVTR